MRCLSDENGFTIFAEDLADSCPPLVDLSEEYHDAARRKHDPLWL